MNFLDLYKTIRQLDEGSSQGNIMPQAISAPPSQSVTECGSMEECGDMPMTGHQETSKQQDSVSMNVSMNASGAGGIRNLMDILKNIDEIADKGTEPSVEPRGDDSIMVGEPEVLDSIEPITFEEPALPQIDMPVEEPTMSDEDESVMDEFESSKKTYANDPEIRKMSVAAVIGKGNDIHSKGKEAPKQAGGGNPWNVNESSIAAKLSRHYEEVKSRNNVTEGYWGWDPPDDPEPYYGHSEGTIELDLPAPYDINLNSEDYDLAKGDVSVFNVSYDANGDTFDITSVVYYTGDYPDVQIDLNKVDPKWFNYVSAKMDDILEKRAGSDSDDYDGGYDDGYNDSGWQDAQNRWEKGRDSRY